MRWIPMRQAAFVGLALFLVVALGRTAWMERVDSKTEANLGSSGRWLRGVVMVIDPGHGGDDPGAVVRGTLEKDVVLQISHVLQQVLEKYGARVIMTREKDEDLGGPIREELGQRVAMVEKHGALLFVSIHANKDGCNCWGAQTFFQRNGMPAGKSLALAIQNQLRQLTPTTRVALPADYFVLRNSPVPATMVEVGFLTNAGEHARLKDPDYQHTLAAAIALGIADFLRSSVPEAKAGGSIGR